MDLLQHLIEERSEVPLRRLAVPHGLAKALLLPIDFSPMACREDALIAGNCGQICFGDRRVHRELGIVSFLLVLWASSPAMQC